VLASALDPNICSTRGGRFPFATSSDAAHFIWCVADGFFLLFLDGRIGNFLPTELSTMNFLNVNGDGFSLLIPGAERQCDSEEQDELGDAAGRFSR
jgi:hypothetical protein